MTAVMQLLIDVAMIAAVISVLVCLSRRRWIAASVAAVAVWVLAVASNNVDSPSWRAAAFATVVVTGLIVAGGLDPKPDTTEDRP